MAEITPGILPLDELRPNPRNYNRHSTRQVERMAEKLRTVGYTAPAVVRPDGTVLGGHLRRLGLLHLREHGYPEPAGIEPGWGVPVRIYAGNDAEELAVLVGDNPDQAEIDYDMAALAALLDDLAGDDMLAAAGYDNDRLDEIMADLAGADAGNDGGQDSSQLDPDADLDAIPENPPTRCQPGQVWELGRHRLMVGDCTRPEDVARLFGGETVHAMLTDPPYCSGGFQEAGKRAGSIGTRGEAMIANDTLSTRGYTALMKSALANAGVGIAYLFTDWRMWIHLFDVAEASGFGVRNMIVWDKQHPGMGHGWRCQHELILCGVRVSKPFDPKKAQGNVIACSRSGNKHHPTEKPVELLQRVIAVTDSATTWYDAFAGSGSTILACEAEGRQCFAMELDPRHADTALQRWENATGEAPRLVE